MRKFVISLAAAGAALVVASPAAAQYYPQPQPHGSGYTGYGYNNYGQVRALQAQIDSLQYRIRQLDRRNIIRDRTAERLRSESRGIEYRLQQAARYGLNPYEANDIQARIARLEQRVQYASVNRYRGYGYGNGYSSGYNGYTYANGDRDDRRDDDRDREWDDDRDDD